MIGNEMHRAARYLADGFRIHLSEAYERVLALTDLTVAVQCKPTLRRELLRWRDLVAALYISEDPDLGDHNNAFRVLLQFTPVASEQIPYVLSDPSSESSS